MSHTGIGGRAMAKPTISPDTEIVEQRRLVPLYRVVLLDDNDHT